MNEKLTAQFIIDEITNKVQSKYSVRSDSDEITQWLAYDQEELPDRAVLRLKRLTNKSDNWKTIAISLVEEPTEFQKAFSWVATIKDDLLDPESADLYFIGAVTAVEVSPEFCTNIESKEQFCRKYILRPGETVNDLIERTFLSTLTNDVIQADIVDPLYTAIQQTGERIAAFSQLQQSHWRQAFLSGSSGAELIDELFKPITYLNQPNNAPGENYAE